LGVDPGDLQRAAVQAETGHRDNDVEFLPVLLLQQGDHVGHVGVA
jgi:hypothetical protein